jgi:hypothetical protein
MHTMGTLQKVKANEDSNMNAHRSSMRSKEQATGGQYTV